MVQWNPFTMLTINPKFYTYTAVGWTAQTDDIYRKTLLYTIYMHTKSVDSMVCVSSTQHGYCVSVII